MNNKEPHDPQEATNDAITGIRTNLGEYVIGKLNGDVLRDAVGLSVTADRTDPSKTVVNMYQYCPFSKTDELVLSPHMVQFMFTPSDATQNAYTETMRQAQTGIVVPEKKILLG